MGKLTPPVRFFFKHSIQSAFPMAEKSLSSLPINMSLCPFCLLCDHLKSLQAIHSNKSRSFCLLIVFLYCSRGCTAFSEDGQYRQFLSDAFQLFSQLVVREFWSEWSLVSLLVVSPVAAHFVFTSCVIDNGCVDRSFRSSPRISSFFFQSLRARRKKKPIIIAAILIFRIELRTLQLFRSY